MSIEGQHLQPEAQKPEQHEARENLARGLFHGDTAEQGIARKSDLSSPEREAQLVASVTMDSIMSKVQVLQTAGYDTTLKDLYNKFI